MQPKNPVKHLQDQLKKLPKKFSRPKLFLAISGGLDSSVLAHSLGRLKKYYPNQHWLHVNYGLRGKICEKEEAHLKNWAALAEVDFSVKRLRLKKANLKNFQEQARQKRYHFFSEIMAQDPGKVKILLTGHHFNDQAETVLTRLLRGSSLRGLSAMADLEYLDQLGTQTLAQGLWVFRPFLALSKESLENYAIKQKLSFYEDQSNLEGVYLRNRLRLKILPLLKKEDPQIETHLNQVANEIAQVEDYLQNQAKVWLQKTNNNLLKNKELLKAHPALRAQILRLFLERALKPHRVSHFQLKSLLRALESGVSKQSLALKNGLKVQLDRENIALKKRVGAFE